MVATCSGFAGVDRAALGFRRRLMNEMMVSLSFPCSSRCHPSKIIVAKYVVGRLPLLWFFNATCMFHSSFTHQQVLTWAAIVFSVSFISLLSLMLGAQQMSSVYKDAKGMIPACARWKSSKALAVVDERSVLNQEIVCSLRKECDFFQQEIKSLILMT